ncbi:MAG: Cna B-type domain-containing protein, partial [Lachnospiraceae bacterium]|nr:Cna B-type domain-containing protein [Lachnospiraceae bacterium]
IDALSARGLYTAAGGYTPKIGDIVFLNLIGDEMADHVGIVTEVRSDGIQTIEGNCDDAVQYMNYTFDGEEILGYGVLPEEPDDELAEELIEASAAAAEPEENEEENEKQVFFLEDPIEEAGEEETEADASDSLRDGNEPAEEPLNIAGAVSAADERLALSAEAIGPDADGLLRYTIVVSSETGTENPVRVKSEMDGVAYWNDLAVLDQNGNEVAIQDGTVYAGATAFDFALRTMAAGDVYTLRFTAKLQETADPAQIGNAISVRSFFGAENLSHELYLDPNSRVELEPVVEEAAEKSAEIENAAEDELPMQYERSLEVAGADYMLQVQYDDASGIPEDADFVFDTLTAGEAYEYYAAQALEAVSGESGRVGLLGMFDLSIYDGEGNSLQPEAPVKVRVAFDEALAAGMKVYAVHFPGTGTVEAQPAQSEITEHAVSTPRRAMSSGRANLEVIEATNENGVASFEASGFSVYAIVGYTVDFSYEKDGQTYQYSLEGGSKVMLSQLFDVLGVEYAFGTAADVLTGAALVDNVSDVVFSDESLVAVTAVSGDWELESLEAFRTSETLTITMTDGGKIVIQVTDAQIPVAGHGNGKITVSKNMEYLDGMNRLSSGKIQFALMKDGEWVRSPWDSSKPYVVEMNIQGDGLQQSTQTFTGLEDGEYDVWEVHGDVNNDIIKRSYDGMMLNNDTVEIDSIRVVYNSNGQQNANGLYNNNATIKDGSEASMTFRNIYKPTSGKTSFEVNKVWMDRKENIIQAPEGAVIAFTLYQEVNGVTSDTGKTIVLDGVADKEGESNPWQAVFSDLPTKTADGQTIRYKVRETSGWPDYYVCKNKGKNLMRDNEYLETSGGTIYNRHLLATIQIQKHFDIQPNKYSAADWAEVLAKKQLSFELTNETTHETWYFTLDDSFSQSGQLFYLDVPNMQAGHYVLKEYRYKGLITDRKWDRGVTIYERDINPGDNMDNPLFEMQVQNWYVDGQDEPEGAYFKALKVWDDLDDFDEIRPESVTVRLQATVNGQEYALPSTISNPITLSEENEWNTGSAWYDLPIVDNNGNTIEYTVVEENVPEGYTCETTVSENGTDKSYTFTNTHRPQGSGTIKLKKVVDAPAGVEIPNTYYFVI